MRKAIIHLVVECELQGDETAEQTAEELTNTVNEELSWSDRENEFCSVVSFKEIES